MVQRVCIAGFQKGKKELSVGVNGPLIVDDLGLVLRATLDGVGLAFVAESDVPGHLSEGTLLRVLQDWCQPYPGFFLLLSEPSAANGRLGSFNKRPADVNRRS